ncbi:glycoside hydrolase family 88 protein [Sphingobacterium siyangense subsp. cladoniae]|uniref:glycoside hydrolase family 88 protein n=1 Tax=Sphingobacterium siyangense TaxID=459529 RepID=UPI0031F85592
MNKKRKDFNVKKSLWIISVIAIACGACAREGAINLAAETSFIEKRLQGTLVNIPDSTLHIPRSIQKDGKSWRYVSYQDWTSGFWSGELWYAYELSGQPKWKEQAAHFTQELRPLAYEPVIDHDLGFQIFNSFGNAYRLTGVDSYRQVVLAAADSLATLFNPKVGTILSWPRAVPNMEWPQHNTIIDNMINLELLFWASKNGGADSLYHIAVSHAKKTMENHFRDDYTSYHVVVYDKANGKRRKQVTHQGFADISMWARGQSWAIYGYTMVYRETKDPVFLDFAQKVTDVYLDRLPEDLVPYWDFDDPNIPNTPRDASAAAVVASALFELCQYVPAEKGAVYRKKAELMLTSLARHYHTADGNTAILGQVTGHYPNGSEINTSINYGDYYYMEALLRYKNLRK